MTAQNKNAWNHVHSVLKRLQYNATSFYSIIIIIIIGQLVTIQISSA